MQIKLLKCVVCIKKLDESLKFLEKEKLDEWFLQGKLLEKYLFFCNSYIKKNSGF